MKQLLMIALMGGVLTGCANAPMAPSGHAVQFAKVVEIHSMSTSRWSSDSAIAFCKKVRGEDDLACQKESTIPVIANIEIVKGGYTNAIIPAAIDLRVGDSVQYERVRLGFGVTSIIEMTRNDCPLTSGLWSATVACKEAK